MNYLDTCLKVKHTSLAAEAKIIKAEELRYKKHTEWLRSKQEYKESDLFRDDRMQLYHHRYRKGIVSFECRAAHLARAFIKKKPYASVETRSKKNGGWKTSHYSAVKLYTRVAELIAKYESQEAYYVRSKRRPIDQTLKEVCEWVSIDYSLLMNYQYMWIK